MKRISYLLSLLLILSFTLFTACKDDGTDPDDNGGDPTEEEVKTEQLTDGSWTVDNATRDDEFEVDLEGQTVTLSFTESGAFTATSADALPGDNFPSGGTWDFATDNLDRITLTPDSGDPLTLVISTLNDSDLTFTYDSSDNKGDFTATVSASK